MLFQIQNSQKGIRVCLVAIDLHGRSEERLGEYEVGQS
jgi:hypothetical protein